MKQFLFTLLLLLPGWVWAQVPTITNFTPKRGGVGTTITITGTNFSTTPASNIVWFGAVKSPVLTATATTLTVKVPAGASCERISVTKGGLTAWTRENFLPTFQGTGTIDFSTLADNVDFALPYSSNSLTKIIVVDIDGDGKPDVASPRISGNTISMFRNTSTPGSISTGSFAAKYDLNIGSSYELADFTFSDVDNDGKKDLICAYSRTVNITCGGTGQQINLFIEFVVYKNQAVSGTINATSFATGVVKSIAGIYGGCNNCIPNFYYGSLEKGDFNLDGKEDLVFAATHDNAQFCNQTNVNYVFQNNYSASITTTTFAIVNSSGLSGGWIPTVGNLNSDNKPEVCLTNLSTNAVIYRNNSSTGGSPVFASAATVTTTPSSGRISLIDFDNDTKNDYFNSSVILQNNISGNVFDATAFGTAFSIGGNYNGFNGFCDINGDGKIDICRSGSSLIKLTPNIHAGGVLASTSFGSSTDISTYGGSPGALTCNDIDLDGKPDVIFVNSGSYLSIMRNQTPTTGAVLNIGTVSAGIGSSASVPVTATDLNGIEGFQFTIAYDQTKLSYQNCSGWDAGVNSANVIITNNSGTGKLTFVYNDNAFSIANGPFFTINFNVIASGIGSTAVSWNDVPTPREFINSIPNILDVTYNNGTVTIVNALFSVSGTISYDNTSSTPMSLIPIDLLNSSNAVIASTTTNVSGQYSFAGLANGTYTVVPSTTKPWGGATSIDLTLYKKHIGNVPGFTLTGLRLTSGDVNLSTTLSALDITLIKQRIGAQISSFVSGDWVFESGATTVSGANVTKNIKAICYGDANGSHNP